KAGAATKCDVDRDSPDEAAARGPFLAARPLGCASTNKGPTSLGFALQLKSGWYIVADAKEYDVAARNGGSFDLSHDWPGVGPVLEWHGHADHHHVSHSRAGSEIESYSNTSLVACAVDRAGQPYCLAPMQISGSEFEGTNVYDENDSDKVTSSADRDVRWSIEVKYVDGAVEISGSGDCTPLPGRHGVKLKP